MEGFTDILYHHIDGREFFFLWLVRFLLWHLIGTCLAECGKDFIRHPVSKFFCIGLAALKDQLIHTALGEEILSGVVQFSDVTTSHIRIFDLNNLLFIHS